MHRVVSSYALTLSQELAAAVARGRPLLPLAEIRGAEGIEPRPVRLLDPRGAGIAAGFADPENQVVRVLSRDPGARFDGAFFRRRVERALAFRRGLGLIGATACRAIHGEGDGLSGLTADLFGDFAVLWCYSRALADKARLVAEALRELAPARGVVLKLRPRGGAASGKVEQEIVGEAPPETLIVVESGVPCEVHLQAGMNVGLFTDMREHRRGLGRFAAGRRVLNAFAYSGTLSVAAARGGAREVTSVDLSSGVLRWAAENFRHAGLDPEAHRFVVSDVSRYLARAAPAGERFDLVILDPPTFSAARASGWSMKNDYPELIARAVALIDDGGLLWVSANTLRERRLLAHVEEGLAKADRTGAILELGGLPPDHPTPLGWPEGRYLEVCLLRVGS
jgi:23S rRNA (cytosine1962-C5)-methyltransferase